MTKNKLSTIAFSASAFVLLVLSVMLVLSRSSQSLLEDLVLSPDRKVIATLKTDLSMPNKKFKILKVRSQRDLWIEIYDLNLSEDRVANFKLPSKFDGQMFINKKASSLFASDIDGDQILEIIAPSFSSNLRPKVHAFRYNPITDSFSEISDQDLLHKLRM